MRGSGSNTLLVHVGHQVDKLADVPGHLGIGGKAFQPAKALCIEPQSDAAEEIGRDQVVEPLAHQPQSGVVLPGINVVRLVGLRAGPRVPPRGSRGHFPAPGFQLVEELVEDFGWEGVH